MKSACTLSCRLCMAERKEICYCWRKTKKLLLNKKSEVYGSYKCQTRFHRFEREIGTGTDDVRSTENCHDNFSDLEKNNTEARTTEERNLLYELEHDPNDESNLARAILAKHNILTGTGTATASRELVEYV